MWNNIKFWLTGGIYKRAFKRLFWLLVCLGLSVRTIVRFSVDPPGAIFLLLFLLVGEMLLWSSAKGYLHGNVVPYWGQKFGIKNVHKLLRDEEFVSYAASNGMIDNGVEISKSGKWIRCKGYYYPLQLIRGYASRSYGVKGNLYFIDGSVLRDQIPYDFNTVRAFEELFPPMFEADAALDHRDITDGNLNAFNAVWKGSYEELANADWGEIRYQWEKKYAELYNKQISNQMKKNRMKMVGDKFNVHKFMFGRVLDDEEIRIVLDQIEKKRIKEGISRIIKLENYSDDYCVCNGIRLLDMMGYPGNAEGMGFLFDCIRDVQKPYCNDAIEVLRKFPREILIERIDKDLNESYAKGDVVWAAGILILAKAIGYEASLKGNSAFDKEQQEDGSATVVRDEEGIGRFRVLSQGGAQMAKGFELKG